MRVLLALLLLATPSIANSQLTMSGDLARQGARPLEAVDGIQTEYGEVTTSEGLRLRTLISRPTGAVGPLPTIFYTQPVSCGSIEFRGSEDLLAELVRRSGWALIRVERSGTGDSEGPGCDRLDYDSEVRHYREAFAALEDHRWVDSDKIVVLGRSLGSTVAPLVAEGNGVAGVAVQGGGAETYLERMIDFDRLYLERSGAYEPEQIHAEMTRRIPFLYRYLILDQEPEQIEAADPRLTGVWASIRGTERDLHYGRPKDWHRQAAKRNFLSAWLSIEAPVLVFWGEYEQFERRNGAEIIVQAVNARRPGSAQLIVMPKTGHALRTYADAVDAYDFEGGTVDHDQFLDPLVAWLETLD